MIHSLPEASLDSVPNVFRALGVYKCACWGPKLSSAFSRTSASAHLIPIVSSTSIIAFVHNAHTRIALLSITRAAFVLVRHLSHLTPCQPRATRPAAHPRSL